MAKLLYRDYYKRYGIRRYQELMAPRIFPVQQLALSKYAAYNYTREVEGQIGPDINDYFLKHESTQLWVQFAPELTRMQGNPRRNQTFQLAREELEWRSQNPRFRILRDPAKLNNNINAQVIENFAHLDAMYIYKPTMNRWLDIWTNRYDTIWRTVNRVASVSDRQQYLVLRIPTVLPKITIMRTASKTPSRTNLLNFPDNESLTFFDFFRWLGPQRESSPMTALDRTALERLNIIFTDGYNFFVANLGLLEGWREQLNKDEPPTRAQLEEFQRRWMQGCTKVIANSGDDAAEHEAELEQREEERIDIYAENDTPQGRTFDDTVEEMDWGDDGTVDGDEDGIADDDNNIRRIDTVDSYPTRTQEEDDGLSDADFDFDFSLDEPRQERRSAEETTVFEEPEEEDTSHEGYLDSLTNAVVDVADKMAESGSLSGVQYKAAIRNANAINEIKAPFGDDSQSLADYINVTPEEQKLEPKRVIADTDTMQDKSMNESTLAGWDEKYVNEVMQKDIAAAVVAIQQAGYPVTNYAVEEVTDVMGDYFVVTVQISPVGGTPGTFKLVFPKTQPNGIYTVNGQQYRLRKQRVDLPIRKISPTEVALSTAYGKVFVRRSEKVVNDVGKWISRQLRLAYRSPESALTQLKSGNVFHEEDKTAYYYSTLSQYFVSLRYNNWEIYFDTRTLPDIFGEEIIAQYNAIGRLPIGKNDVGEVLAVSIDDRLWIGNASEDAQEIATLPDFLGLNLDKMPREDATIDFMGISIPLGIVLAYYVGLGNLLTYLRTRYRVVPRGGRLDLALDEVVLPFDDDSIIYSRDDKMTALLLGGFWTYRKYLNFPRGLFDKPDVYLNVLEGNGIKVRHLAELDRMDKLFIDPVSRKLLQNMHEPTEFKRLLLRAGELLLTNWSPRANDANYQRYKTYDKYAELTYRELIRAIRLNENNPSGRRVPITLSPVAVWNELLDDSSAITVDETNPALDIKQGEESTLSGTNGRSKMTMRRADSRAYDDTDLGAVSSDTKDSGDVGISVYLAPNANVVSIYGETRRYDPAIDGTSTITSTSVMAVPAVDRDDAKRELTVGIQQNRMIYAKGYDVQPWRTGGESVWAARNGPNFAVQAKADGKIKSVNARCVVVEYDDPELDDQVMEIGTRIGKGPGKYYPHILITDYKVGDIVKALDVVVFHKYYYKRDWWNPGQVLWRSGSLALIGILDIPETHEDSSFLFQDLARRSETISAKPRVIVRDSRLNIRGLVKVGDTVGPRDILATFEEPLATDLADENQDAVDTLNKMSQYNPRADVHGTVVQVNVFYRGQIEDMSESMAEVVTAADRRRAKRVKELNLKEAKTGLVRNPNARIDGEPLGANDVAIQIFVQYDHPSGMGDKGTFVAQAKSVTSSVGHGVNETEDGRQLDAIFSGVSISNRIIGSPEVVGTVNLTLAYGSEEAAAIYFNEDKK